MPQKKIVSPPITPCQKCPLRRLKGYREFTPAELQFMVSFKAGELRVESGATIFAEGAKPDNLLTVLSGWALKYKSLPDGRRQVLNFALPGDLIGLQASTFDTMKHSVEALTDVTLCILPRKKLRSLYEGFPGLAFDMTWIAAREEWILGEYLLAVGQRRATERLAFVLLDVFRRARRAGLTQKNRIMLPVTQSQLSDTIGFSLVHTNKSLQRLRRAGCFSWSGTEFEMLNEKTLDAIALQDPPQEFMRPFL